jgi:hypothetical protein
MIKYYKKLVPRTQPRLSNGAVLNFKTLDGLVGYFASDNEYVHTELEKCMTEGRYEISEISADEFKAQYLEKKSNSTPLKEPWREEIGAGSVLRSTGLVQQLGAERVSAVVGVSSEPKQRELTTLEHVPPPPPTKTEEFKPAIGKRGPGRPRKNPQ